MFSLPSLPSLPSWLGGKSGPEESKSDTASMPPPASTTRLSSTPVPVPARPSSSPSGTPRTSPSSTSSTPSVTNVLQTRIEFNMHIFYDNGTFKVFPTERVSSAQIKDKYLFESKSNDFSIIFLKAEKGPRTLSSPSNLRFEVIDHEDVLRGKLNTTRILYMMKLEKSKGSSATSHSLGISSMFPIDGEAVNYTATDDVHTFLHAQRQIRNSVEMIQSSSFPSQYLSLPIEKKSQTSSSYTTDTENAAISFTEGIKRKNQRNVFKKTPDHMHVYSS